MVKRKRIERNHSEPLRFIDGIPSLQRSISESGPSIPSSTEHAPVDATQKEFGLAPSTIWDEIKNQQSYLIPTRGDKIVYSSENDIAGVVKVFLTALIRALDLDYAVEIHSEVGTFDIRPDMWVVTIHGIPVGVIEVKKPDIPGRSGRLETSERTGRALRLHEAPSQLLWSSASFWNCHKPELLEDGMDSR